MIKVVVVICCLLTFQKDTAVISWTQSYKLSWKDFQGESNSFSRAAAVTASGITFEYSIKQANGDVVSFTTDVKAHFYPEESWYKSKLADDHILGHEQLHYDITELFARKFRQDIYMLKPENGIVKKLKALHKTINKELNSMQNLYDAETNYSINAKEQIRWHAYVSKKLEEFSKYKSVDSQP